MDNYGPFQGAVARLADVTFLTQDLGGRHAGLVCRNIWRTRSPEETVPIIEDPDWVNAEFDFVMTDSLWLFPSEPWDKITIPKGCIWGDNHSSRVHDYLNYFHDRLDVFLPMMWESFCSMHGERFRDKVVRWMPWSINPVMFRNYGLPKIFDVLSTGVQHDGVYPVRVKLARAAAKVPAYHSVPRPAETAPADDRWPCGDEYAKLLNTAKMCLSCSGKWEYALGKTFEIPAAWSVLVSDLCRDARDLGHVHGETMVEVTPDMNETDIHDMLTGYLSRPGDLAHITMRGYELMHKRHTNGVRAAEFLDFLEAIL